MDVLNTDTPVRVIESEGDYETALSHLAELMIESPAPGTNREKLLKTLAVLIRDYETQHHSIDAPDPIEAIRFRMDQQGLAPKDLIPYLGTKSRVSEVLGGKRPLTLTMIRSLHRGLGIPAASLLGDRPASEKTLDLDWSRVPFTQMKERGWIQQVPRDPSQAKQILDHWMAPLRPSELVPLYRRHVRSGKPVDHEKLTIWTAQVAKRALERDLSGRFDRTWSIAFLQDVARISVFRDGPALLREFLEQHGIALVVEPPLAPWLDGAALMVRNVPVVGLTLRHDRLDNFWFVVMHELVHLLKHLTEESVSFYDDLDSEDQADPREIEADKFAGEILIPADEWRSSPASRLRSVDAANHLARRLRIHPAIVAGKIRKTYKDYRILSGLVGQGEVRKQFPEFGE